jgi:uncharacterized protein (TIGR02099 family)
VQKAKRVFFYCLHKLWLTFAVLLVLLAVLISVLRYSLPHANDYKQHIEQLISSRYGATVQIAELSAGWQKYGPALLLKNVRLYNSEQQLQISIRETRVRLDFWGSLLQRQLTARHFELSGLTYYLDADSLLASGDGGSLDTAPILAALETLFFQQLAYFSVLDSQLVLQNDTTPDLILNIKQLDWVNSGNRHQGNGELSLAGVTANTLTFVLDLHGDELDKANGQLYLASERLDVLPWFAKLLPPSQKLKQADINFKAWGQIERGLLRRIQVELADNSLSWIRDGQPHRLQLSQGQLLWQPTETGWSIYSGALTLAAEQQQWQDLQLQLHRQNGSWSGSLNNFRLEAVTPLANLLAEDIAILQQLVRYQPSGHLQQLQWQLSEQHWQLAGEFAALQSEPADNIPGISGIGGQFLISDQLVKLTLLGEQGELRWDGLFTAPMPYERLAATLYWQTIAEGWRLQIPTLTIHSPALQLDASMQLDNKLQILARLQHVDAANASAYFPQRYMPETVRDYLEQAIQQGQLRDATVLWHGAPAEFPYREQQGVFQVLAQLEQGTFAFAPDWPLLQQLNAQLWFENASMHIQSNSGELAGLTLDQSVSASIADLFHADTIDIHIQQQANAQQVTALIQQSPLQDSLGAALQHLGALGQVQGDVLLEIGLQQPAVRALGTVDINGIVLQLAAPQMQLDNVNGRLSFDNGDISAEGLSLTWRGLPVAAALQGSQTEQGYSLQLQLQGEAGADQLASAVYAPLDELIQGQSGWQFQLQLALAKTGFNYAAQLHSTLENSAVLLPAPYQKAAAEKADFTLVVNGDAERSWLSAHYNDNLHFHAEFLHQNQQIKRAHLIAGPDDSGLNGAGFSVSVALQQADFLTWFELLQHQLSQNLPADKNILPPLTLLRGNIAQLDIAADIALHNSVFELKPQAGSWQLKLNADEVASRILFDKDWDNKGITAELEYLRFPLPEPEEGEAEPDPLAELPEQTAQRWLLQLPPIKLTCADCSVGPYRFGKVHATAHSTGNRWILDELKAVYQRHQLSLQGQWQNNDALGVSQFSGVLQSANLGAMLDEFQITSAISGSNAEIEYHLNWSGAPHQFRLANLAGDINYKLGDGALTEVSDKGSRLFSIFSLDSLLRKLRLDFRDVFAKGFYYNSMKGNLALSQGVVQTSDASIDGVPGSLQIQGYADLVSRKLDYQMAFSPKVTSSLPVIIAWMVNPATGLAALALDEVFQSAEVISKINFIVTGSFDEPVVTEVNRHSKEVPVPVRVAQPDAPIEPPPAAAVRKRSPSHG